jgi:hypothetical protein
MVNINTALSGKDFLFDDIQTLELFLFFIGIIIFFSIIKKLYYRF